jgi:autotransporter-associated beta strand protein
MKTIFSSSFTNPAFSLSFIGVDRFRLMLKGWSLKLLSLLLVVMVGGEVVGQVLLSEGFESGLPTAYSSITTYSLGSGTWTGQASGVIRGTSGVNSGSYSLQLKSQTGSQVTSPNIAVGGVSVVTFYGAVSSGTGSVQVNFSTDAGATWTAATGSPFSLSTTSTQKTATINSNSPNILVQFYRAAGTVLVDDIVINTSEPTTQASAINFSSVATISMTVGWTNGNGGRRAVFMKAASGAITNPTDGTAYTASSNWSSKGTQIGTSGYYCIYNGTGSSVSLTNLNSSQTYYLQVFEYNSDNNTTPTAATINYFTSTATGNPNNQTTTSPSNPSLVVTGTTDHGSTCPNSPATTKTYTITNTGTASSNVVVSSSDAQFVVSNLSSTSIGAANGTATYDVTFTPTSSGAKTATITVYYNTSTSAATSSLTGTGTTSVTQAVTSSSPTFVTAQSATLNGNYTAAGVCPATIEKGFVYSLSITNNNPLVNGTGVTNTTATLGSTGTYSLALSGLPSSTGYSFKAYVFDGTTYTYGTVQTFTTSAPLAISGALNNGSVCPNVPASAVTYTVTNNGSTTVSGVAVNSSDAQFVVSNISSSTIAPSGTATYTVIFTPSSAGSKSATITVSGTSVASVTNTLTGTGTTPVTGAVVTNAVSSIVNTTATLNGSVTTLGVCPATSEKGFVYSVSATNSDPIVDGTGVTKTAVSGLTTGAYTLALTGLTPVTNYTVKSYIYNGSSYIYGSAQTFSTLSTATKLVFGTSPTGAGNVGVNLTTFTIQAQRADNSVDAEYVGNVTIVRNIISGSANLTGTISIAAVAGTATFSAAQFDAVGTYTITASSASLTTVTSGNIVVSLANATAILWSSATGSAWLTGTNWTGSSYPTNAQVAQFNANPTASTGVGVNFNSTTNAGTQISGSRIQEVGAIEVVTTRPVATIIGNSSSTVGASGTLRLNGVVVNGVSNTIIRHNNSNDLTIQNTQGSGNLTMGLALGNPSNNIINIDGTGGVSISSIISGSGPLTKAGAGTGVLTLSGANTYTGGTNINAGAISVGADANIGNGSVTLGGGTLAVTTGFSTSKTMALTSSTTSTIDVASGQSLTANGIVSGSGNLTKTGPGTLILSAANTYTGTTTISAGTINVTGITGITSTSFTASAQSVTFSNATPTNGDYQLFNGPVSVTTQSFSSNAVASKSVTFNYSTGAISVADVASITSFSPTSGGSGTSVVITGTNLTGTTDVKFNGTSVGVGNFTVNSATQITATVPAGLSAGGLVSIVKNSTTVNSATNFVVNYYLASGGSITNYADFGQDAAGTDGNTPTSINSNNYSNFYIVNNTSVTQNANITLGTGSKIIVGDGINATTLIIAAAKTTSGTLDVKDNGTLTLLHTTLNHTLGTLGSTSSTVVYNASGAQTVATKNYANLTISGGNTKTLAGAAAVSGTLTINGTVLALGSNNLSPANLTLDGLGTRNGTWGSTSSSATYKNNSYFSGSGLVTVTNNTALTPSISGVTASQSITYGAASITLTGTVSATGPVYPANGETVSVTINGNTQTTTTTGGNGAFSITYTCNTIPYSATPYDITYAYAGNGFLNAASETSTSLTISKADQYITFASTNSVFNTVADYNPGATSASSGINAITYTSSNTAVATIVSGNIHVTGVGQTTITASQASSDNYNAASATQTLTVNAYTSIITQPVGYTILATGATPTALSVTAIGTNLSYQWYSNTTNSSSNGVAINLATSANYTPPSTSGAMYYYVVVHGDYGSDVTSDVVAIVISDNFTWNGSVSTDWNTAANWTPASVPIATANVSVPNLTNNPVIDNLTIASNGSVTLASGTALTLSGTITNNGTFTIESGATLVQGLNSQISGNGTFSVLQNVTGTSTGNFRSYYLGSPLNSTSSSVFSPITTNNLLYNWNANTTNPNWYQITNNSTSINPGVGYLARFAQPTTLNFSGLGSNGVFFNNAPSNSPIQVPCYRQASTSYQGFNLVSNPFPSYLDWNDVYTANSAFSSTIWYRIANGSNAMLFDTYNATALTGTNTSGLGDASRYVAPMQSFWVRIPSGGPSSANLSFSNSMREHYVSGVAGLRSSSQEFPAFLRLNLVQGNTLDQIILYMKPDASSAFDSFDSEKMFLSGTPQLYSKVLGKSLVINGMRNNKKKTSVPLSLDLPTTGLYFFQAEEYNIEDGLIILEDKQENVFQDLTLNNAYSFYHSSGTVNDRFVIHFHLPDASITAQGPSNIELVDNDIHVEEAPIEIASNGNGKVIVSLGNQEKPEGRVQVLDASGRIIFESMLSDAETMFDLQTSAGIYYVKVSTATSEELKKIVVQP